MMLKYLAITCTCLYLITRIYMYLSDGENSLITPGPGMRLLKPLFFCMDKLNNFVLIDRDSDLIRVFSPKGNLLHT